MNIKVYDNEGKTFDRYTVVYLEIRDAGGLYSARGMSTDPYSPLGFCQMTSAQLGPHLGKEIEFKDLPPGCRRVVDLDLGRTT